MSALFEARGIPGGRVGAPSGADLSIDTEEVVAVIGDDGFIRGLGC